MQISRKLNKHGQESPTFAEKAVWVTDKHHIFSHSLPASKHTQVYLVFLLDTNDFKLNLKPRERRETEHSWWQRCRSTFHVDHSNTSQSLASASSCMRKSSLHVLCCLVMQKLEKTQLSGFTNLQGSTCLPYPVRSCRMMGTSEQELVGV